MQVQYQYSYTLSMKENKLISISYSYTAQNTIKDYTIRAHPCEHIIPFWYGSIRGTLNISTTLVLKIWYTSRTLIFSSLPRAPQVKAQVRAAQLGVTTFVMLPEFQWSIGTKLEPGQSHWWSLSFTLSFFFLERLHRCYTDFHCSYLYGYYNSSRTLCTKCSDSAFRAESQRFVLRFNKISLLRIALKRGASGRKEAQRESEHRVTLRISLLFQKFGSDSLNLNISKFWWSSIRTSCFSCILIP
jgi:hypothetical protein